MGKNTVHNGIGVKVMIEAGLMDLSSPTGKACELGYFSTHYTLPIYLTNIYALSVYQTSSNKAKALLCLQEPLLKNY